jgi:hypothetical protein
MVICVLAGKLLSSTTENEAGRAAIPSTIREASRLQSLKFIPQRIDFVGERILRNIGAVKSASHGMAGQKSLRCVGQRFSRTVNSFRVRRDQAMMLRHFGSHGNPGCAGGNSQSRYDEFPARIIVHDFPPPAGWRGR